MITVLSFIFLNNNLLGQNNDSRILEFSKNTVQTLFNKLFSLDQYDNENIFREHIE